MALPDKAFSDQKCTKFRPPGPLGSLRRSPDSQLHWNSN